MRKMMLVLAALAVGVILGGCSTKTAYIETPGSEYVDPAAQFNVGDITDSSGFQFAPDDEDAFNLADAMRESLQSELSKYVAQNTSKQYSINIDILKYAPGNAFARWLMPGAGATKLSVNAAIIDDEGGAAANIPVERSIAAGGGFTIGAWKYVFDEVAAEIVKIITDISKRKPPKEASK